MIKIKDLIIGGHACLAPMAGDTDKAFRRLCHKFGASYSVSEMVSSKGISYKSEKSAKLMEIDNDEHPCGVQIFGDDPCLLREAAIFSLKYNPDVIDINMGCPAPKISSNGSGAALMKNRELCGKIVKEVSSAVSVPVSCKIRKGFDENSINAVEIAKTLEENGASFITIHGRTKEQYYKGQCDLDIIKKVKEAVDIPIIGNGDIKSAIDAKRMYEYTGVDLVMVGRASLGNPWIFKEINQYFEYGKIMEPVSLDERLLVMKEHIEGIVEDKGESIGIKESRKHVAYYLKGIRNAASFRNDAFSINTLEDFYNLIEKIKLSN